MKLQLIILLCCQSHLLNCDNEHHQDNPQDTFNDQLGLQDTILNSLTMPTEGDHNHEANRNPKIIEDHIMTGPEKFDKKLVQSDHRIPDKEQPQPIISQNNPYLDNQDYGPLLPSSTSQNKSSKDYLLPYSRILKYYPALVYQTGSLRMIQEFGESTISSQSTVTNTPSSFLSHLNLYLTKPKVPDDFKTDSKTTVLTKLPISNTTIRLPSKSLARTKTALLRKMLSTRNEFEEIFGNEMANFFALDKLIMTRPVKVPLPTEEVPMNAYELLTEAQTEVTEYTTEPTKPIARMRYLPKRKTNATRLHITPTINTLPLYLQYLTNNIPTLNTELTRNQDIDSTIGITEVITNAITIPSPTTVKAFDTPTIPHVDLGILTATAKQEQLFSEDTVGIINIGTPVFDVNTMPSEVNDRPIYVPTVPTRSTTVGDVLHGAITVSLSTPIPRLHAYHELMESLNEGYMMVFLLELSRLVAMKPGHHVQEVVIHTETIVNELFEHGRLSWFGRPLMDITLQLSIFITEAEIDVKKSYAAMLYHMLAQRRQELSAEVNSILEYADLMYKRVEGEHLLHVLKEFEEFPNVTLKGYWLCESLIQALLHPFRRLQYSPRRQVLLDSINKALQTRFPNYSYRKPGEKVEKIVENSPDTSQVATPVTPATLVTRPGRVRLRRKKRKRRRKRKGYYHPHRHHGRKHHRHTQTRLNEDIVFL